MLYVISKYCKYHVSTLSFECVQFKILFFPGTDYRRKYRMEFCNLIFIELRTTSQIFTKRKGCSIPRTFNILSRHCRPIISLGKVIFHVPGAFHYSFFMSRYAFDQVTWRRLYGCKWLWPETFSELIELSFRNISVNSRPYAWYWYLILILISINVIFLFQSDGVLYIFSHEINDCAIRY